MHLIIRFTDGLIAILSPIAAIFYLLGAVLLIAEWNEHPGRVDTLAAEGAVAEATVSYINDAGDVHVEFHDAEGRIRYAIIEEEIYSAATLARLEIGATANVRYDPHYRYEPALEEGWTEFATYRKRIDGLLGLFLGSLIILAIRPDFLYIAYVQDFDALYKRDLRAAVQKELYEHS